VGEPAAVPEPLSAATIEHLLDDMRDLRLTFVADLSAAAAALEADSDEVAGQIVESDRQELLAFLRRSTARLAGDPVSAPTTSPRPARQSTAWRRRVAIALPAVPLAGALAMSAAAAAGLLPLPTHHATSHPRVLSEGQAPVSTTFQHFETVLAGDPSASQVVAAASVLHRQIAALIANAPQNPAGVSEVAQLLQLEQALLLRKQPPGTKLVLAQSRQLAAQLETFAAHTSAQPTPASVPTSPTSTPHKVTSPKPSTSSSTSPKPTSKASSTPSSSPSPSPSSTDAPGHIPTIGG